MKNIYLIFLILITNIGYSQSKKLSDNELITLGKVWGTMKYYQPAISQGKVDWDNVIFTTLDQQENKKQTVDEIINTWFAIADRENPAIVNLQPSKFDSITLRNYNFDWINKNSDLNNFNKTRLLKLVKSPVNIGKFYSDPKSETNRYDTENEKTYDFQNENTHLLDLFRLWNVIEYYYPYKYLLGSNWDKVLKKYIPLFRNIKSELDYKKALTLFSAEIQDTHVQFTKTYNYDIFGNLTAPFTIQIVDNGAVITKIRDEKIAKESNIEVGDFITKVNGKSIVKIIKENSKYIPASNKSVELRESYNYLFSGNEPQFTINAIKNNGLKYTTKVTRIQRIFNNEWDKDGIPDYHLNYNGKNYDYVVFDKELQRARASTKIENKLYIDFSSVLPEDIDPIISSAKDTKGIVFDLRGYNDDPHLLKFFNFLFSEPQFFGIKTKPDFSNPGKFLFVDNIINQDYKYIGKNNTSAYSGQVVILINEYTQSAEEMWAMIFKKVPNVVFIGSQTSGADGNKTPIKMTNDNELIFSGVGIYYPNGEETQRIGIKPDVSVRPTRESIVKKEDLLLLKAFQIIDSKK